MTSLAKMTLKSQIQWPSRASSRVSRLFDKIVKFWQNLSARDKKCQILTKFVKFLIKINLIKIPITRGETSNFDSLFVFQMLYFCLGKAGVFFVPQKILGQK